MIYLKEGTKHIYYCLGVKAIINGRHYINILGNYIWILRLEISFLVLKIIKGIYYWSVKRAMMMNHDDDVHHMN